MSSFYRRYLSLALAAVLTLSSALNVNAASYEEMEVPETEVSITTDDKDQETLEDTLSDEEKMSLDETVSNEEQVESEESLETEESSFDEETDPAQEEELLEEEELTLEDPAKEISEESDKETDSSEKTEFSALEAYELFQEMDYVVEDSSSLLSVGSDSVSQAIVTGFKASWSGHDEIDLLDSSVSDGDGLQYKTYVDFSDYNGNSNLIFTITIKNSSDVASVDVIGVIDGKSYTITAEKTGNSGTFKASGRFKEGITGSDISSISLKLRSNRTISTVSNDDSAFTVNSEMVERYQRFNDMCGKVSVEKNGSSKNISVAYDEFFSPTAKKVAKETFGVLIEEVSYDAVFIENLMQQTQVVECLTRDAQGGDYQILYDTSDSKSIIAYFIRAGKPASTIMKYMVSLQDEQGVYNSLTEFSAEFSNYLKIAQTLEDYTQYNEEYDQMVSEINSSSSIKDKDEAIRKAKQLRDSKQLYSATSTLIIPLVVACLGGLPGGVGIALLATGAKTFVDCAAEYFWEVRAKDILGKEVGVTSKSGSGSGYINWHTKEEVDGKVVRSAHLYGTKSSGLTIEIWGEAESTGSFDFCEDNNYYDYRDYAPYVTRVVFLSGVKKAHANASAFPRLEEIVLPEGLEEFTGADSSKIKKIKLPRSLKKLGDGAFENSGVERIDFSGIWIEEIGANAFKNSAVSGTVKLPSSCTKIGENAFYGCKSLKKVQIEGNIETLHSLFKECSLDELVINGNIGYLEDIINKNTTIKSIYLLGKITELQKSSWSSGRSVNNYFSTITYTDFYTKLTKQEVLDLGLYLIRTGAVHHYGYDPSTGKEAVVKTGACGKNLTYVLYESDGSDLDYEKAYDLYISGTGDMYDYQQGGGNYYESNAPWGSYKLANVYLTEGITRIGDYAGFRGNTLEIPGTVKSIGKYAFYNNQYKGILIIPDSVQEIGEYALCVPGIKNVYIGKGLTTIPKGCFGGCSFNGKIIIPENITEIGDSAFSGVGEKDNSNVTLEVKGNALTKVGESAFSDCKNLYFSNPDFISNLTYIGRGAFSSCKSLRGDITFSDNLTMLGDDAFENCTGITSVTFNCELNKMGSSAFEGCTNLTSASITGVREIGMHAFEGCKNLQTLMLGEGVQSISWYAFRNCKNLTGDLEFPSTTHSVGMEAFKNCSGLTGVKFNEDLYGIEDRAFKNCTGLKGDLVFSDKVANIGSEAFKNCSGIDGNLVFTEGYRRQIVLGYGAFENCSNISGTVTLNASRFNESGNNSWQKVFYGMDKVEEFLIKGTWIAGYFTAKGETGNYLGDDPDMYGNYDKDETGDTEAIVDISTFPANATLKCVEKKSYENLKDLGYDIVDVSGEYKGYRLKYETGGHGLTTWWREGQMTISLPSLSETGYTFGGWYLTAECKDGEEAVSGTKLKADTTIYAKWTANQYKVTFDPGEGQIVKGDASKTVTFDGGYGELPVAEFGDNAFAGWSTTSEGRNFVTAQTVVSTAADHTLYAVYKQSPKALSPTTGDAGGKELSAELRKGTKIYLFTATGGASIYFTTNAAEASSIPEDDAHLYKMALTAEENMTIYAKTVKAGYRTSDVMTKALTVIDPSEDYGDVTVEDRIAREFTTADKIPTGLWVAGYKDVDYTGSAITFDDLHVYYGKKLLTLNEDYTVKYSNNIKASTDKVKGTITVTGKGNYSGTNKFTFDVKPISLGDMPLSVGDKSGNNSKVQTADIQVEETGKVIKGTTTATYTKEDGKIVVLKSGTDFTYDYSEVKAAPGTYNVIIKGKGNYTGFAVFTETVYPKKTKTNIAKLTFTLAKSVAADGSELKPDIKITDKITDKKNPYDLVAEDPDKGIEGDYHVEYFNNILPGTATVVVTGKGEKYAGTKTLTFKITGIAISKAKVNIDTINPVIFDGTGKIPGYTLTYQANKKAPVETLFEGEDFTVTPSNNVIKGNGTLTFTGIGKYTGTIKKTFKIGALNFSSGQVRVECSDSTTSDASSNKVSADLGSYAYTKNGVKPDVKLMFGDEELVPNRDYKIKYANNNAVTVNNDKAKTPTITITGAGNFAGSFTRTFSIGQASLETATVTATDILESTKAVNCKPTITVYDTNGVKLVAGKDYDNKNIEFTYVSDATILRKTAKKFVETQVNADDIVDVKNDIVPAGTDIKVTLHGKGLYASDSSVSAEFSCVDNMISKATVKLAKGSAQIAYTGSSNDINESDLQVLIGDKVVPKGAYRITKVENTTGKGTARITIAGTGLYTGPGEFNGKYFGGEKTVTFKIVARSIK